MIGKFAFPPTRNLPHDTATLEDDGTWTCTNPSYQDILNFQDAGEHPRGWPLRFQALL
jgi:hypothetical protein